MKRKVPKYIDDIQYWLCPSCKIWKPFMDYYKDKRTTNGLKSQCKNCHQKVAIATRDPDNTRRLRRESMRRMRKKELKKYQQREKIASQKRPKNEKTRARDILNRAVKKGEIIKPRKCEKCGEKKRVTAHHFDYSEPLEVVWWCYECHQNK